MRPGLLALLAVALCVVPAADAGAVAVGYNEDAVRALAVPRAVKRSNVQVMRVGFLWQALEPQRGVYDWELLDHAVALMREARIRPMITAFGSPRWAAGGTPGINCACDRAADPDWQALWAALATRYPDAILNVWNEPNLPTFGSVSVERMAELANEAAAAIWAVDPDRLVVGPPTAPWGDWTKYSPRSTRCWIRGSPSRRTSIPAGRMIDNLRAQLAAAHRIAGRRPIWITETNVSRCEVSARAQVALRPGDLPAGAALGDRGRDLPAPVVAVSRRRRAGPWTRASRR